MIDYRAIEEAEAILDQKMADTTDPVIVAAGKLKRGIIRSWAIWVAENNHQPDVVHKAGARIIGDLIVELAINAHSNLNSAEHAALITHDVLCRVAQGIRWDMSGRPGGGALTEVSMSLNAKADS